MALLFTTSLDNAPRTARFLLWIGFTLHLAAMALDLNDNSRKAQSFDPRLIESLTDLLQFLALQFYLFGAIILVAAIRSKLSAHGQTRMQPHPAVTTVRLSPTRQHELQWVAEASPLGLRLRLAFCRYIARGTLRGNSVSRLYVEAPKAGDVSRPRRLVFETIRS